MRGVPAILIKSLSTQARVSLDFSVSTAVALSFSFPVISCPWAADIVLRRGLPAVVKETVILR